MKFLLDNNLPPALAKALHELSLAEWDGDIEVIHLKARFAPDTTDEVWIADLAKDGVWSVITQDKLNKGLEREAIRRAGLKVFMLDSSWGSHSFWEKATNLVRWWPAIVEQTDRINGGAAFRVRWNFSGKGKFEQLSI